MPSDPVIPPAVGTLPPNARRTTGTPTGHAPAPLASPKPDDQPERQSPTAAGLMDAIRSSTKLTPACAAVLDAETTPFAADQIPEVLALLRAFIAANRDSGDSPTTVATASAVRTYVALLPAARLDEVATLFTQPGQPEGVELELAKMVTRKLTANPPGEDDPYPATAARLAALADAYLDRERLTRPHYGAVAVNSILGIALMRSLHWPAVVAKVEHLPVGWFRQQLGRRAAKLIEEFAREGPTGRADAQQAALRQLVETGRRGTD